jgi:hypothetical protein
MTLRFFLQPVSTVYKGEAPRRRLRPARRNPVTRSQLRVEALEDRALLSAITWIGSSGDWDTASNWSTGSVPTAANNVTINVANVNNLVITHSQGTSDVVHSLKISNSTYALDISAGSLTVATASTDSGALSLSGGTLSGPGSLTISGELTWSGGTMSGSGTTTAKGGITIAGDGATETLDTRRLNNASVATWSGTENNIEMMNGSVFANQATGSFTVNNDQSMTLVHHDFVSDPVFINAGAFTKAAGLNTSQILVPFNNTGKVTVSSGTLQLAGGGNDSSGSFTVPSGSSLVFGGNTRVSSNIGTPASPQAGTLVFGTGTTTVAGSYNVNGITTVDSGTVSFSRNVTIPTLNLVVGILTGPAAVTVTTLLTWKLGGAMTGTGSTILAATATMSLESDVDFLLDTRTFINKGAVIWAGSSYFNMANGATFNNRVGATFAVVNDNLIYPSAGTSPTFNNAGSFIQSAGTNATAIFVPFNNTGTVSVSSGTLQLAGGNDASGSFMVASGNTLVFTGNTLLGSHVSGGGSVDFRGGTTDVTGTYNITGSTEVVGCTVEFQANVKTGTFSNSQGTVIIDNPPTGTTTFAVASGNYTQTAGGSTFLNGATLSVAAGNAIDIQQGTNFYGLGTVIGDFSNAGSLYVGGDGAAGILKVSGNYTQSSTGTLSIDIGGTSAGAQYDQLSVVGTATLDGILNVFSINSFTPTTGTTFTFMSCGSIGGDFASKMIGGFDHVTEGPTSYTLTA